MELSPLPPLPSHKVISSSSGSWSSSSSSPDGETQLRRDEVASTRPEAESWALHPGLGRSPQHLPCRPPPCAVGTEGPQQPRLGLAKRRCGDVGRTQLPCCGSSTERVQSGRSHAARGHSEPRCPHLPTGVSPPLSGDHPVWLPVCSGQQAVQIPRLLRSGWSHHLGRTPLRWPRACFLRLSPLTDLRAGVGPVHRPLPQALQNQLKVKSKVAQSCPTLCDPVDCSPPGSSVHGIFPDKSTRVGCHSLLQGIFPTQGSNLCLPPCRQMLYCLNHQGSP